MKRLAGKRWDLGDDGKKGVRAAGRELKECQVFKIYMLQNGKAKDTAKNAMLQKIV